MLDTVLPPDEFSELSLAREGAELASHHYDQNLAMSPVYRLPDEVIADIQAQIQAENYYEPEDPGTTLAVYSTSLDWLRVMLSCRRMREVALRTISLWSFVDATWDPPEWHAICLERSLSSPLTLHGSLAVDGFGPIDHQTLRLLPTAEHARLSIVHNSCESRPTETHHEATSGCTAYDILLEHHLHRPMPQLRRLTLDSFIATLFTGQDLTLSTRLFGGRHENLTYLSIHSFIMSVLPYLPKLKHLMLQMIRYDDALETLRQSLLCTPALKTLRLDHGHILTYPYAFEHIRSQGPVCLPHLSELHAAASIEILELWIHILPYPRHILNLKVQIYDELYAVFDVLLFERGRIIDKSITDKLVKWLAMYLQGGPGNDERHDHDMHLVSGVVSKCGQAVWSVIIKPWMSKSPIIHTAPRQLQAEVFCLPGEHLEILASYARTITIQNQRAYPLSNYSSLLISCEDLLNVTLIDFDIECKDCSDHLDPSDDGREAGFGEIWRLGQDARALEEILARRAHARRPLRCLTLRYGKEALPNGSVVQPCSKGIRWWRERWVGEGWISELVEESLGWGCESSSV